MRKKTDDNLSGIIVIDKHEGVTSHTIVSKCRRLFDTSRIGHTGTLDPMATGVLPVMVGRAAKASDYLMADDKEYECRFVLGFETDTEDVTGDVISTSTFLPPENDVIETACGFIGKQSQIPPMYSAIKVNGRKLVDLARRGETVERKAREIEIKALEIKKYSENEYFMKVKCSKGTYIRTLCADIGKKLGCGAAMSSLRRTQSGCFTIETSIGIAELEAMSYEERVKRLMPVESVFLHLPEISLTDAEKKRIRDGMTLDMECSGITGLVRLRSNGEMFALGKATSEDGHTVVKQEKLFIL